MNPPPDAGITGWRASLCIGAEHPALAGHFPSQPVVPGVLLLDEVLHLLAEQGARWRVEMVKFHYPVLPGQSLQLLAQPRKMNSYAFEVRSEERVIASGLVQRQPDTPTPAAPAASLAPAAPRRGS
jgi:3-hydroxymyristoyl/3-hydroxydecanoyl-(acyl carrier protein) dehydratase